MFAPKLKLWLPVLCFVSYIVAPLDKWIFLITLITNGNHCPDAEKYITNLAFLIFYLAFLNVLLLAFIAWKRLLFEHMLANFLLEIGSIFVIFYHSQPAIADGILRMSSQKNVGSKCLDVYVTESFRVHAYLIFGYFTALFIRILLWKQTKLH